MFDPKTFQFDVEKMTDFFRTNDFTKQFANLKMPGLDPEAVLEAQKKNMDALVRANQAAAAGYQDLFKKQVAIFEETMSEAQKHLTGFDTTKLDADAAKGKAEIARAAFEKALANMQMLAETAQKANAEAYEIVSARIQESMSELREMAQKLTARTAEATGGAADQAARTADEATRAAGAAADKTAGSTGDAARRNTKK